MRGFRRLRGLMPAWTAGWDAAAVGWGGACVNGARALHKSAAGEAARPAPWRCFATSLSRASAPPRPADLAWDSVRGLSSMHAPCCRAMSTSAGRGGPGRDASSRNRAVALYALAGATFMLGLSYVAVPLYRMFCAATGYGGTVQRGGHGSGGAEAGEPRTLEAKLLAKKEGQEALDEAARNRPLRIRFDCNVSDNLRWKFRPCQRSMSIRPGESVLAFYTVTNDTDEDVIGVSTYNVVPFKAGPYFNKVQCFCFEEQKLRARESIDMPVFFYVDKEFAVDPRMADVRELVLSYTFYKVEQEGQGLQQLADRGLATPEQQAILAEQKGQGAGVGTKGVGEGTKSGGGSGAGSGVGSGEASAAGDSRPAVASVS